LANITDKTLLKGIYNIDYSNDLTESQLDDVIAQVEAEILLKLFGDAMYLDYVNNKTQAKYVSLINGVEYNNGYNTVKYNGLKVMLVYFAYYYYQNAVITISSPIGEALNNSEMGEIVMNRDKQVKAWNRGVLEYNNTLDYLRVNFADFPLLQSSNIEEINSFGV
jgi:hypothetical protein